MRAPIFIAATVCGTLLAIADQSIAGTADPRIADISLADLNLSSAEGMRTARDRLQAMAQRVCAEAADGRDLSSEPNFTVCVDSTVAAHLKQRITWAPHKNSCCYLTDLRAWLLRQTGMPLSEPADGRLPRQMPE